MYIPYKRIYKHLLEFFLLLIFNRIKSIFKFHVIRKAVSEIYRWLHHYKMTYMVGQFKYLEFLYIQN